MVIPIRKTQANKLKEASGIVIKGGGRSQETGGGAQEGEAFPPWIEHGQGLGSHRCRLNHVLSHYRENGFINLGANLD